MVDESDIRIEFPCDYPIHIIGAQSDAFARTVLEVVRRHDDTLTPDTVTERKSSRGRFASIRVTIRATGEAQLKAMHADLMDVDGVRMVL